MTMRVAHCWAFFGALSERFIAEEILALQRAGVEIDIVSLRPAAVTRPSTKDDDLRPRVRCLDVSASAVLSALAAFPWALARPWSLAPGHAAFPRKGTARLSGWLANAGRRARLAEVLASLRPDVLHAQHGHLGWMALPVAARRRLSLMVSLRGEDVALLQRLARGRWDRFAATPCRFLARCRSMAEHAKELGLPPGRILVHPSGIAVGEIPFRERRPPPSGEHVVLLSVGRLVAKKGMADALSALAASRWASHRAVLRIIGEGPEDVSLRRLARQRGVEGRVSFLGPLPHTEVLAEMQRAHVFVLASRGTPEGDMEGIPNVLKEAAAAGLPVVSTRHAGIPEFVEHDVSGLLASEGDVDSLAACLDDIVRRGADWPSMGRRGRQIVERDYDIARLTPRLIQHYRDLVAEARGA
jgi:glycosyltransferase involved in cell wall biosynthesis